MQWKMLCVFVAVTISATAGLAAQPGPAGSTLPGEDVPSAQAPGDCRHYNNSRIVSLGPGVYAYASSGSGCTECTNLFPSGGGGTTLGSCYYVNPEDTYCIYNQIAPWTDL
jgi:hypothetical protein